MSYIGRQNLGGAYRQLDDISSGFEGSDTTHTMQVNSQNVTVGDVNQIILSLGGVIQKPGTDFTVSGSVLTFTTAPAANTSFFAILLGSDNGGTVTPTDKSVTVGKIDINGGELFLDADDDTSITASTDDQIDIKIGGNDVIALTASEFAFNDGSGNIDFRVESDNETSMLHVNAGTDTVLIGTATPTDQWFNADGSYVPGFMTFGNGNTDGRLSAFVNNQADAGGPIIGISKSRGTASNSYTVVQDDDQLGIITFQGADGTNLVEGASIRADVDGTPGADDMPGRLEFFTTADGASSGTERMRIHSDGDVSIGTTNGRSRLEVFNSSTGSFDTSGAMGATATDDNIVLGLMNTNNSATHTGLAFETRTTGAGRFLISNRWYNTYLSDLDFICRDGASSSDEILKMRADGSGGQFFFGQKIAGEGENPVSQNSSDAEGIAFFPSSYMAVAQHNGITAYFNRMGTSGDVIKIRHEGNDEGAITVTDAGFVSISSFTGTHWSRLEDNSKPTILMGTIIESVDKMMEWYQVEYTNRNNRVHYESISLPDGAKVGDDYDIADPNFTETKYQEIDIFYTEEDGDTIPEGKKIGDRRPGMDGKNIGDVKDAKPIYTGKIVKEKDSKHVYSKISDTADSKKVYGLFSHWDDADDGLNGDVNDFLVAQVGTFIIRVNKDVTVEAGDLLVSNGDGTAKLQDDDIIRSKTVAKVNSNVKVETYSDGSYTVPCTLHC